jgi:hypothetical protein
MEGRLIVEIKAAAVEAQTAPKALDLSHAQLPKSDAAKRLGIQLNSPIAAARSTGAFHHLAPSRKGRNRLGRLDNAVVGHPTRGRGVRVQFNLRSAFVLVRAGATSQA